MPANEPDPHGMHTTDTIDYVLVVAGEVTLEPDDGVRTVVRAGDAVVQNGTRRERDGDHVHGADDGAPRHGHRR